MALDKTYLEKRKARPVRPNVEGIKSKAQKAALWRYRFRLITPALMSRGLKTPGEQAELRLSGLLGALRFWWRAMAWSQACQTIAADPASADLTGDALTKARLDLLADWQRALFGGPTTSDGSGGGHGVYTFTLHVDVPKAPTTLGQWMDNSPGLRYMIGLSEHLPKQGAGKIPAIPPGTEFTLTARRRPGAVAAEGGPGLNDAVNALALFGGIGRRSRRGFGALQLVASAKPGEDMKPYTLMVQNIFPKAMDFFATKAGADGGDAPAITAFGTRTRVVAFGRTPERSGPKQILDAMGATFVQARRATGAGELFEADRLAFDDAISKAVTSGAAPVLDAPLRGLMGLPHNYFEKAGGQKMDYPAAKGANVAFAGDVMTPSRRASPLFFTVRQLMKNDAVDETVGLCLYLPAQFLPGTGTRSMGAKVSGRGGGAERWVEMAGSFDEWDVIEEMLDGFSGPAITTYKP